MIYVLQNDTNNTPPLPPDFTVLDFPHIKYHNRLPTHLTHTLTHTFLSFTRQQNNCFDISRPPHTVVSDMNDDDLSSEEEV